MANQAVTRDSVTGHLAAAAETRVLEIAQAKDTDLTTIAALDATTAGMLATDGAGWIRKTYAQVKTALALVAGDVGLGNVDNTSNATERGATRTLTNARITKRVLATAGPGATPTINTDSYDVVNLTALAANLTSMTTGLTGTPVAGDTLRIALTDNGTARTITWGASFESSTYASLPGTTTISTRMDLAFVWNTATSKWRLVGVA